MDVVYSFSSSIINGRLQSSSFNNVKWYLLSICSLKRLNFSVHLSDDEFLAKSCTEGICYVFYWWSFALVYIQILDRRRGKFARYFSDHVPGLFHWCAIPATQTMQRWYSCASGPVADHKQSHIHVFGYLHTRPICGVTLKHAAVESTPAGIHWQQLGPATASLGLYHV